MEQCKSCSYAIKRCDHGWWQNGEGYFAWRIRVRCSAMCSFMVVLHTCMVCTVNRLTSTEGISYIRCFTQERQFIYNVALRRVRERPRVLPYFSSMERVCAILWRHFWPLWLHYIFSTLSHTWHDFRKKWLNVNSVFEFLYNFCLKHSSKNSARYCDKCETLFT
jgi:hypothetical protein